MNLSSCNPVFWVILQTVALRVMTKSPLLNIFGEYYVDSGMHVLWLVASGV